MEEKLTVCGKDYALLRLLGHGKGGYSYLARAEGRLVVLKQIHHEPCDYYRFGNKIEAERYDYGRLKSAGIRVPEMLAIDTERERIVKEYIEGETIFALVRDGVSAEPYLGQVRQMAALAKAAGLNIDYFPTNFVVREGLIWYVDYECSPYSDQWNFENWGIRYWSRGPEFEEYLRHAAAAEARDRTGRLGASLSGRIQHDGKRKNAGGGMVRLRRRGAAGTLVHGQKPGFGLQRPGSPGSGSAAGA